MISQDGQGLEFVTEAQKGAAGQGHRPTERHKV